MLFIDTFLSTLLTAAAAYNKNDQCPPACLLWPDKERQWQALLPRLRPHLPILTLGPYRPHERSGPAYWLRCAIAGVLPEVKLPAEATPIIYLPGVSRQELRAIEDSPKALQPLAELVYRGQLWTQKNGRDWTILAFLQSKDGGLGLEVESDAATRAALRRALPKLAEQPLERLQQAAPLKAAFFDSLLTPDEARRILLWLNDPQGYAKTLSAEEWAAFCQVCQQKYGLQPQKDGPLAGAEKLGYHSGAWDLVWQRYSEAPTAYPNLPALLLQAQPKQLKLLEQSGAWPQENEAAENALRQALHQLADLSPTAARQQIHLLEQSHAARRAWVWAQLGFAPLARALRHLDELAVHTAQPLGGSSLVALQTAYLESGWQADSAAVQALEQVDKSEDLAAVKIALRAVYQPWLEQVANAFQTAAALDGYPAAAPIATAPGVCLLFSDALRFDAGMRLAASLQAGGLQVAVSARLSALPGVTPTAKPAVSPLASALTGEGAAGLTPRLGKDGANLTAALFRSALAERGWQALGEDELGDPTGQAWTELGATDTYGHQHGWKIAKHLAGELDLLKNRIFNLLDAGWKQVVVVTDHGWLLLPGGLPKVNLPEHLTAIRKGRCARLKDGAVSDQQTLPWFWDGQVRIAIAPGVACYEAGKEYEHGGLSPQECITPVLTVTRAAGPTQPVAIEKITWKGLRCEVYVDGGLDLMVDIRSKAADPTTSLVAEPKQPDQQGRLSLLIDKDDSLGQAAFVVVTTANDQICAQALTTVGG